MSDGYCCQLNNIPSPPVLLSQKIRNSVWPYIHRSIWLATGICFVSYIIVMFVVLHDICCCVLHFMTSVVCVFYVFWHYFFTVVLQNLWNVGSLLKNGAILFLIKPTDALISQIYFVKKFYMFRAVPLPIIRSFPLYIRHWYMSCRFWWQLSRTTILVVLESCHQICMTYTSAECTVENSWWWAEELP